uniref:Uncharacterized protein n=1 Tax=Tanacetum cinerariifolium TaxID=118510 RepID=A0A6L2LKB0_TANCI|nr:hypothetical protein [Tanacetum cinerariifolium]
MAYHLKNAKTENLRHKEARKTNLKLGQSAVVSEQTRVEGSVWGRVVEVMWSSGDSGEGAGTWESGWVFQYWSLEYVFLLFSTFSTVTDLRHRRAFPRFPFFLDSVRFCSDFVRVMSSSPHSTIVPSDSDIENIFSSMNILNYFSASPGSISLDFLNNFTKYLLNILVFLPLHDDSKIEVIQAYDTIPPPQVVIALPTILPPSLVLSLSPMFDSRDLFPSKEISPKDTKTPVESPIPVPPSPSEGSSSPVRSTTPDYLFDESIFAELDNSLWIISRSLENKPIPKEPNKLDTC